MTLWKRLKTVEEINALIKELPTMLRYLDMKCVDISADALSFSMPVDERTRQPDGILHGGASAALAETVGSMACYMTLEGETKTCVGLDLSITHLKAVHGGFITAVAKPIKIGGTLQVWEIRNYKEGGDLIAFARLNMMIIDKPTRVKI